MSRVHDMLRWANRTAVADEITRRGYRVSPETLNRWVRQDKEVPAIVERIVFDLFTISGHEETAAPVWAAAMHEATMKAIEALVPTDIRLAAERVIERLEALPPPAGEAQSGTGEEAAPGGAGPQAPGRESPPDQAAGR